MNAIALVEEQSNLRNKVTLFYYDKELATILLPVKRLKTDQTY